MKKLFASKIPSARVTRLCHLFVTILYYWRVKDPGLRRQHVWINLESVVAQIWILRPVKHVETGFNRFLALCRSRDSELNHIRCLLLVKLVGILLALIHKADLHGIQDTLLTSDFNEREIRPLEIDVVPPSEVLRNGDVFLYLPSLLVRHIKCVGPSCVLVDPLYPEGLVKDCYTERSISGHYEVEQINVDLPSLALRNLMVMSFLFSFLSAAM